MVAKSAGHWLQLRLEGTKSNCDAVGYASVSASSRMVHFGLGAITVIPTIVIHRPSGAKQTLPQVQADRTVAVREP